MTTRQPSAVRETLTQYEEDMDGYKIHGTSTNASVPSSQPINISTDSAENHVQIETKILPSNRNAHEVEEGVPKNRPPGVAPRDSFGTLMSWDPVAALWRSTHNREETRKPRQNIKRSKITVPVPSEPNKPVVSSNLLNDLTFQAAREAANWMPQPCGNVPVDSSSIPMFWDGASQVWRSKQHLEAKAPVWVPPPSGLIPLDSFGDEMAWDGTSQVWRSLKNRKEVYCSNSDNHGQRLDFSEFGRLVQLVPTNHRRGTTLGAYADGIWRTIYVLNRTSRKWRKKSVPLHTSSSAGSSDSGRKSSDAAGLNCVGSGTGTSIFTSSCSIQKTLGIDLTTSKTIKKDKCLDVKPLNCDTILRKDRNELDSNKVTPGSFFMPSTESLIQSNHQAGAPSAVGKSVVPCTKDRAQSLSTDKKDGVPSALDKVEPPSTVEKARVRTVKYNNRARSNTEKGGARSKLDKVRVRKDMGKVGVRKAAGKTKGKKKTKKMNSLSLPVDTLKGKSNLLVPHSEASFLANRNLAKYTSSASTDASNSTQTIKKSRSNPRVLFTINGLVSPKELGKLLNPKRRQIQSRSPESVRHLSWE